MKKMSLLLLAIAMILASGGCDQLSDYDKVSGEGIETRAGSLSEGDLFRVESRSVMFTGFFKAEQTGGKFLEMRSGDLVRFSGWTVKFPTGVTGYEFEIVELSMRGSDNETAATPHLEDKLYLSENEIVNHLKRME